MIQKIYVLYTIVHSVILFIKIPFYKKDSTQIFKKCKKKKEEFEKLYTEKITFFL